MLSLASAVFSARSLHDGWKNKIQSFSSTLGYILGDMLLVTLNAWDIVVSSVAGSMLNFCLGRSAHPSRVRSSRQLYRFPVRELGRRDMCWCEAGEGYRYRNAVRLHADIEIIGSLHCDCA